MKHVVLLSLCLLCFVAVATAQNIVMGTTGNDLLGKCKGFFDNHGAKTTAFDDGYCAGYLDATLAVEGYWATIDDKRVQDGGMKTSAKVARFCLPNDGHQLLVTNHQLLLVVKKWMDDHPEQLHEAGVVIIHQALVQAFPCK